MVTPKHAWTGTTKFGVFVEAAFALLGELSTTDKA